MGNRVSAVIIEGVAPWDGRYEFADFALTNRELYRIKQLSGIRAGELIEALEANDTAAYVGFAVAIMERNGVKLDPDDLWNAPVGSITIDLGSGDVADPPTIASSGSEPNEPEQSSGDDFEAAGV